MSAREWKRVRRDLQPVFQDPKGAMNPRWSVKHLVGEPLRRLCSLDSAEVDQRVRSSLAAVGMGAEFLSRYRHQLSGGQQQRVNIARAISVEPRCIILDEPVAALDSSVKRDIVLLLNDLRLKRKLAFLLISHDLSVVRILCRRVIILFRGRIVEMGPTRVVTASPRHPYTRELLAAQLDKPSNLPAGIPVRVAEDTGEWSTESGSSPPNIGELVEIDKGHFVARDVV
jgi:ABC-type microcin C transport system duplicated ATPase subunit YejF